MAEQDKIREGVKRMSDFTALLYYHLTKAMIDTYGDSAKDVIKKAIHNFGYDRGQRIAAKVRAAGLELTIENLDKFYDMPIDEGWAPQRAYEADGAKNSKTESCSWAEFWINMNWAEIGYIYCSVDPAIREGYNPNIVYHSTHNIFRGDKFCSSVTAYKGTRPELEKDEDKK